VLSALHEFWFSGWGFDKLYNVVFVRPFLAIAKLNKADVIDQLYTGIVAGTDGLYRLVARTQSGSLRWYIMGMVIGAILILGIQMML
jgi:NADH-quinone oxidoreductase subunit L